ncbi:MAG: HD domain-containing protein [Phycisphaerae bacterium]|nr:HD domain-containing protein [Phycisphaerae bacterium]
MEAVSVTNVRRFQPQPEWFARGPGGIHGIVHETRVLIWSQVLAAMVADEGLVVDPDVLGWASALHDTQRLSDDRDPEHGSRAAAWIEQRPDLIPPPVPLARVAYLCRWHVPPDHAAPELTDELRVFKDADALDRWRIYDLDPTLLRTRSAHRLLTASRELWSLTDVVNAGAQGFQQVIQAAVGMGILQDR